MNRKNTFAVLAILIILLILVLLPKGGSEKAFQTSEPVNTLAPTPTPTAAITIPVSSALPLPKDIKK